MSFAQYAVGAVLSVSLFVWNIVRGDWFSALMATPLVGYFVGRVAILALADAAERWPRRPLKRWQGLYFEYAGRHLRAVRRDDALLFFERDILAAIGRDASRETTFFDASERVEISPREGHGLTRAGCERLLKRSTHPDARPLWAQLEGEAFAPFARRLENEQWAERPPVEATAPSGQGTERDGEDGRPNSSERAAR